jgi:PBSX family phage terminase large subunit
MPDFELHTAKQEQAFWSEKKIILVASGIQWGKTTVGGLKMKWWMHHHTRPTDNFIVTAPTYKIMQQATLPGFLHLMRGYGKYHKADGVFEMHGGGNCWLRTATDPDSIVGITNVRGVWGDEAGKYPLYFWENMQARASIKKCQIILTTSPYSINWVFKELIRPTRKGLRDDVELIQARSDENPYFPADEYQRKKETMDPRRFNMIYGGQFDRMEGLVYDCFREDRHVMPACELLPGTKYVAGIDWGYTNPFALVVIACEPNGRYYIVDEHYETHLTAKDMVDVVRRKKKLWNIERLYCDPSSPANIEEFNRAKLSAIPADNDIRKGVDRVYELFRQDRLFIFDGAARNLVDELENYHYPEDPDINPNRDVKELVPVAQYNHAADALRYVVTALFHTGAHRKSVKSHQESQTRVVDLDKPVRDIEKLKKLPRAAKHEQW